MEDQSEGPAPAHDPYRELFEASADAILIIEGDRFIDCNAAAVEMLRYRRKEELLRTHPSELSPRLQPDGRESFEKANEMIALAFERGSHRFEWDHVRADGEVFPVEVLLTAVQEPDRRVLHVVWRDITERRLLEDQLRQSQKMEAIGKLTGGIAHDFNNLLVAILGHGELLDAMLHDRPEAGVHVNAIQRAGERAAELVRQLLAFGRKQLLLPRVLDLNQVVLELRTLLERLIGEGITLELETDGAPARVKADRGQIEQVLLNLAANARDAMPAGGRLAIAVRRVEVGPGPTGAKAGLPAGTYALIEVADTGGGMTPQTQRRAFEPFFTTKPPGRGTGLGLSTIYGIVKQSGGEVTLASAPGQGTRVSVRLPCTGESPEPEPEPAPQPGPALGHNETVLVVEDDPAVFQLVVSGLESRGYGVLTARDGREALRLYERQHARIDLVLTDVIMPQLGGGQLVSLLEQRGYRPRVLFMSGYTDEGLSSLHALGRKVDVLQKPFDVGQLAERVRAALDR